VRLLILFVGSEVIRASPLLLVKQNESELTHAQNKKRLTI
jgi:hypothetical protein